MEEAVWPLEDDYWPQGIGLGQEGDWRPRVTVAEGFRVCMRLWFLSIDGRDMVNGC